MDEESILKLNEGLQGDALAMKRVEVAIVTFGKTVTVLQDFISVGQFVSPMLEARKQRFMLRFKWFYVFCV